MKTIKINKINMRKENNKLKAEQEKYGEIRRKKREENIIKFEKY